MFLKRKIQRENYIKLDEAKITFDSVKEKKLFREIKTNTIFL
jgi:hypothetical protein